MQPSVEEESEGEEEGTTKEERRSPTPPSCRGVSIEVPSTNAATIIGTQLHPPLQETPVAALRRYLETMPQHPSPKAELKSGAVWRSIRSELVASFLLTVVSSAASIRPLAAALNHPRMLSSSGDGFYIGNGSDSQDSMGFGWGAEWAIGHGLTLGALTWAIRNAHFSLPTTLALFFSRKISVLRAVLHLLAQIIGALAATPVVYGLLHRPPRAPSLAPSMSAAQGWGAEFLANLLVSLISLSSYESPLTISRLNSHTHHDHVAESPKIAHGALLPLIAAHTSAAFIVAGFTGVGLNPARSLAMAAVTGCWSNHWVWWIGPAMGGVVAAFIHEYTGARDPSTAIATLGATPRPSIVPVPRDASRRSFLSSNPASPTY